MTADELPAEALKFLQSAVENSPGDDLSLWEILRQSEIYVVKTDHICGAFCLEFSNEVMNIILLGGENIHAWKDDLVSFFDEIIDNRNIKRVLVVGRKGWGKLFTRLKPIGTIYTA